jgi:hypothetical protein
MSEALAGESCGWVFEAVVDGWNSVQIISRVEY